MISEQSAESLQRFVYLRRDKPFFLRVEGGRMDKPFKTYNQQLKILRDINMMIKNGSKAIKVLKREDYYNIINGYKDIFLDLSAPTETYKTGTEFEQLHALFEFDRNLRGLFLKYILKLRKHY